MRPRVLFTLLQAVLLSQILFAQADPPIPRSSLLSGLAEGDSVIYYQCHVIDPDAEPQFASDYAVPLKEKYTVTEKIVLRKVSDGYAARVYTTTIRDFPNRKFSGLKIRERPYWQFTLAKALNPGAASVAKLAALELGAREAIEYDYPVTKHTRNQFIVKRRKNFKQLLPPGKELITKLLE